MRLEEMTFPPYVYAWRNNPVRAALYGRGCQIVACGTKGTVLIEMADTHERVTTSLRALRRWEKAEAIIRRKVLWGDPMPSPPAPREESEKP